MSDRLDRFKKRQALKNRSNRGSKPELYDVNGLAKIDRGTDQKLIAEIKSAQAEEFNPVYDLSISKDEVKDCLYLLDNKFSKNKYDALFESTKDVLIDQLLSPLKLSRSDLSKADRDFQYSEGDYKKSAKEIGGERESFASVRDKAKTAAMNDNGQIQDINTGLWHDASEMDLDHIKPLENMHNDGGFMLSDVDKREFGADSDNHGFTHSSTNRSKKSADHKEFSDQQDKKEKYNLDNRRTNAAHQRGEKTAAKYVPQDTIGKTVFVVKKGAEDGIRTGSQQGLQQAIGTLLSEFISAVFSEAKDIWGNGWKSGQYDISWIEVLKTRIENIKNKLLRKWKNVATAFANGALSGLLSAIITALLNMFVRTGRNIVRLIREGFQSLMKAVKTLIFPPEGMTLKQAAHEATKVLASGLVITGGILVEEAISKYLLSHGIPLSGIISVVVAGLITGMGSLLVVFMLDKLDLFGVNAKERHKYIMGELDSKIDEDIAHSENIIRRLGIVDY